jgi:hypothetical protein
LKQSIHPFPNASPHPNNFNSNISGAATFVADNSIITLTHPLTKSKLKFVVTNKNKPGEPHIV